ncbi:uncharacterized protein LOC111550137 [Piliocolobus tephrosceles]|uniref:uncharacterized protein LOC111550137 n=1 Tax=Piliocolobus tephrosceles TaxID=591936 RepID=UPI000C2A0E27|nr:uncharacterized protein LOC111550137 [Piliocolobus tephrosceles]
MAVTEHSCDEFDAQNVWKPGAALQHLHLQPGDGRLKHEVRATAAQQVTQPQAAAPACVPAARRPRPRRLLPPLLCTLGLPGAPRACLACRSRRVIRRGIHIPSGPRRPPWTLVRADSFGSSAFLSEGLKSLSRISQEKGTCMRVTVTSCDCGESLGYHGGKRLGKLFEK